MTESGADDAADAATGEGAEPGSVDAHSDTQVPPPSGLSVIDGAADGPAPTSGTQPRSSTGEMFRTEAAPPITCASCTRENPPDARFCNSCGLAFAGDEPVVELRKDADPLIGRVIAGRYRIDEVIGRGGMGVVYRVEHVRMGKLMAMKLLHGDLARDKEVVRRFRREAEAVSKLDHPNTVQVFDFGESDGMTWLVMELLSGKDLGGVLADAGTLDFARAARIGWQIAGSVHQAHERGIVHRDIKPENVRVLSDRAEADFVKVLDFGLAKLRETEEQKRASITREGFLVGTPYYMAPEHIRGDAVDARADVYALGALLYKAVTGVPPFWAPTPVAVLTKHLTEDPVPPRRRSSRRDLPREADEIILRTLEKAPEDRYASMAELKEALAKYLTSVGDEPNSGRVTMPAPPNMIPTESGRRVAIATRDEFDRYEQTVRTKGVLSTVLIALLAVVAVATSWWAWGGLLVGTPTRESEPNDTVTSADPIVLGEPLSGFVGTRVDVSHGDTDVFHLGTIPSSVRWLRVDFTGLPNADTLLDVYVRGRPDPILVIDGAGYGQAEGAPNLPVDPTADYLFRVREEVEPGAYPIENVSDAYSIVISPMEPAEDEEREPNETRATALEVTVPSTWHGYVGWSSDEDLYCLPEGSPATEVMLEGVPLLDLVLGVEWPVTGRSIEVSNGGAGEGETFTSEGEGAFCVRISARTTQTRSDPRRTYALGFAPATVAPPPTP